MEQFFFNLAKLAKSEAEAKGLAKRKMARIFPERSMARRVTNGRVLTDFAFCDTA